MIRAYIEPENARILDVGCGLGMYTSKLHALGARVFGIDVQTWRLEEAQRRTNLTTFVLAFSEALPFPDDSFDAVLLHEVVEHVNDDVQTIREAHRVIKRGGCIIIFAPNRLYPFETHGVYLGKRYVFGNIPLVGYLPDRLRAKLVPHARAYTARDLRALFAGLEGTFIVHTQIYPGYDKIARRSALLARVLRSITYFLEHTPLRAFGLSHFVVWQKRQ